MKQALTILAGIIGSVLSPIVINAAQRRGIIATPRPAVKNGAMRPADDGAAQADHERIVHLEQELAKRDAPARKRKKIAINAGIASLASAATIALLPQIPFVLPILQEVCQAVLP